MCLIVLTNTLSKTYGSFDLAVISLFFQFLAVAIRITFTALPIRRQRAARLWGV